MSDHFVFASSRLCVFAFLFSSLHGEPLPPPLAPGAAVDYAALAFQPETWREKGRSTQLLPWYGTNIVFLTLPGEYDGRLMAQWVTRLDQGWAVYRDLTGAAPEPFKKIGGRATIAAVPDFSYTCGAGCGYVGKGGIELAMFYQWNYPALKARPDAMPHYVFYEMGRNFYTFGDRHSAFTTGFAVFMRYACMDAIGCVDEDAGTRRIIESVEPRIRNAGLSFLKCFTSTDGLSEKEPRIRDGAGKTIEPSDQPVTYAAAMLRLWRENGGNDWLRRFYVNLRTCPTAPGDTRAGALSQSWNWYVCASLAARRDLAPVFCDDWHLPLTPASRAAAARLDWKSGRLTVAGVLRSAPPAWTSDAAAVDAGQAARSVMMRGILDDLGYKTSMADAHLLAFESRVDARPWYVDDALVLLKTASGWELVHAVRNPKYPPGHRETGPSPWTMHQPTDTPVVGRKTYTHLPSRAEVDAFLAVNTWKLGSAPGWQFLRREADVPTWREILHFDPPTTGSAPEH